MNMDKKGEGRIKHSYPDKIWIIMAIMISAHIMNAYYIQFMCIIKIFAKI